MTSISRSRRAGTRILASTPLARAGATVFEPLEQRRLLSGLPFSKGWVQEPSPQPKVEAGPITFTAQPDRGGTIYRDGADVQINVGPVVNISRAPGNQSEVDVAINPTNPDQIFAVSNIATGGGLFSSRSYDGGLTWTTQIIATGSDLPTACCDARVRYDSYGNLYMTYLGPSGINLYTARSINNGQSWTLINTKTGSWDNPAIDVGAGNQVWIEARYFGTPAGVAAFGFQATGLGTVDPSIGVNGFTNHQLVPTTGTTGNFGDIAVLNDGSVLITYTTPSGGQGPANNPVWRDPDGFGPIGFLGAGGGTTTPLFNPVTNVGGFDYIPAQNGRSVDSEPSFAVAPPNSPFAGRVYFTYTQETVNENHDMDIVVRYSDDGGVTWSGEIRVNDDPVPPIRSQFLQQIAVDPTTGAIVLSWHDTRNDNGVLPNGTNAVQNDDAQFYGALSTDGGITWTNFQIDPGWSNAVRANNGIDFGDWTGSDFYGGRFFAVWASNAQGENGLPDNPEPNRFDLATARVDIIGAGLPGVYGLVVDDANGNGVRDPGEIGLPGVTVYVDANGNGTYDPGETGLLTGTSGSFGFTELEPGTYIIRAVAPDGRRPTFPTGGAYTVEYTGTNTLTGTDFGFVNPRVAGIVFNDVNDNGSFDASESGLGAITLYIDANNNGQLDPGEMNVTSESGGAYTLGGLANGTYVVRAVAPGGRRLTFPGGDGSYSATISDGELVFTGRNFGLTDRVRIGGIVYDDANGNGLRDPGEGGIAGARVYHDLNNNGTFDNAGGTYNSTNVPLPVPPSGTVGITTSTLDISGVGNVTSLTVRIGNLTHTFTGDLLITLISPQGTRVTLFNRRGGSGDNLVNTVFDDSAATAIGSGVAPFTGTFRPEQPLSTLIGENGNGTWKLEINDLASGDSGFLNSWSITLGSTEPNTVTPTGGEYLFSALSAGVYHVRQVPLAGQTLTQPASGVYSLNLGSGDVVVDADFGNASALPPPTVTETQFVFDGFTLPDAPHRLRYTFSQGGVASTVDADDLVLLRNGQPVASSNFLVSVDGANAVRFTFPGFADGILPDGQYQATLLASGVYNPTTGQNLPADVVINFFVLAGDANHDGTVNLADFNILAANFGQSPRTFSQGDFNYDGTVNLLDFNILASRFGQSLAPEPADQAAPLAVNESRRGAARGTMPGRGSAAAPQATFGRTPIAGLDAGNETDAQVVLLDQQSGRLLVV